jgi:hypothetical protein
VVTSKHFYWLDDVDNDGRPTNCMKLVEGLPQSITPITIDGLSELLNDNDTAIVRIWLYFSVSKALEASQQVITLSQLTQPESLIWGDDNLHPDHCHCIISELGVKIGMLKIDIRGTEFYLIAHSEEL